MGSKVIKMKQLSRCCTCLVDFSTDIPMGIWLPDSRHNQTPQTKEEF